MLHRQKVVTIWLLRILILSCLSFGQVAIASPYLSLSNGQCGDFHLAITALAEQGQVTIIAEGVPLHPQLSAQNAAKLAHPMIVSDAVRAIADAYDYDAQQAGHVFTLKKRYSNPDDLPTITSAECTWVLDQLQRVTEAFNPHGLSSEFQLLAPHGPNLRRDQVRIIHPLVDKIAASLTPDQLVAMRQSKLFISTLQPNQKKLARKLQLSLYVQTPMDIVALLKNEFEQAGQNAVFCWQDTPNFHHVFGYKILEQMNGQTRPRFYPLSHSTGLEDINGTMPDPRSDARDPTDPSVAPDQNDSGPHKTLADVVAVLNTRSGNTIHMEVDATIAAKTVTIVGADNASPEQIIQALADTCGLILKKSKQGSLTTIRLTPLIVSAPSDIRMLPAAIRQALPVPFVRATRLDNIVSEEQKFYDFWQTPRDLKQPTSKPHLPDLEETPSELEQAQLRRKRRSGGNLDFAAGLERISQAKSSFPALRNAAIKKLRALIEPSLQVHPSGIKISSLGVQEHEALATIFLAEAVQAMGDLVTQQVPDTVSHFDQSTLGGGIQETSQPPSFTIEFHIPNPKGGLEINNGGINVTYNKEYSDEDKK